MFPVNIEEGLDAVIYGKEILKLGNWGSPHKRRLFLDQDTLQELMWFSPAKRGKESRIKLNSVKGFYFGYKERLFQKKGISLGQKQNLAFTIKYTNEYGIEDVLSVVFKNIHDLQTFVNGLQYFVLAEKYGKTSQYLFSINQ